MHDKFRNDISKVVASIKMKKVAHIVFLFYVIKGQ